MNTATIIILIINFLLLVVEFIFSPRLDLTEENKLLLWYNGRKSRKYIVIF